MKKQKIEKEIVYEGLGFPVILRNVPMIEVRGVWTPDIDLNFFQKYVLLKLAYSPSDLTGDQIRFVRLWLGMTQSEFGKLFNLTHAAIVKWEKTENKSSKMNVSTQRDLRMLILDKLLQQDEDFRKAFKIVHTIVFSKKTQPLECDISTDLVAV